MVCDSRFVMDTVVREMAGVFEGVTSLADIMGGSGAAAKAVAVTFPHIKSSILDLPQVIDAIPADDKGSGGVYCR
jgi:trans-resveratrol di-O-methyltransferase